MAGKKEVRRRFREGVFTRDKYKCVTCGMPAEDAHHITDRNLMPNGGYVPENGISLCSDCHVKAEHYHSTGTALEGFSPDDLYKRIGSSYEKAYKAALRVI